MIIRMTFSDPFEFDGKITYPDREGAIVGEFSDLLPAIVGEFTDDEQTGFLTRLEAGEEVEIFDCADVHAFLKKHDPNADAAEVARQAFQDNLLTPEEAAALRSAPADHPNPLRALLSHAATNPGQIDHEALLIAILQDYARSIVAESAPAPSSLESAYSFIEERLPALLENAQALDDDEPTEGAE